MCHDHNYISYIFTTSWLLNAHHAHGVFRNASEVAAMDFTNILPDYFIPDAHSRKKASCGRSTVGQQLHVCHPIVALLRFCRPTEKVCRWLAVDRATFGLMESFGVAGYRWGIFLMWQLMSANQKVFFIGWSASNYLDGRPSLLIR